jgi:hypothetical protein
MLSLAHYWSDCVFDYNSNGNAVMNKSGKARPRTTRNLDWERDVAGRASHQQEVRTK